VSKKDTKTIKKRNEERTKDKICNKNKDKIKRQNNKEKQTKLKPRSGITTKTSHVWK
jgi:hypothetical protein